jgi:hypothetical protein
VVLTLDQRSSQLQDPTAGRLVRVAIGLTDTTMVSVRIDTSKARTFKVSVIPFANIAAGTIVSAAVALFSTTLVIIHVCAVLVIAKYVSCIITEHIARWTR